MIEDNTRASLNLLLNVSRELGTLSDLRSVLSRVLNLSLETVRAERGSLIALDPALKPVDAAIIYKNNLLPHTLDQLAITLDKGLAGLGAQSPPACPGHRH